MLHFSSFQGRNFKKAFIFYFFRALGLKTFIFFVSLIVYGWSSEYSALEMDFYLEIIWSVF